MRGSLTLQDMANGLDKPGSGSGVSPRIKSRDCTIGDKKIGMRRNLVACATICHSMAMVHFAELNTLIKLIALTSLK